jgi:hypothetical protein
MRSPNTYCNFWLTDTTGVGEYIYTHIPKPGTRFFDYSAANQELLVIREAPRASTCTTLSLRPGI